MEKKEIGTNRPGGVFEVIDFTEVEEKNSREKNFRYTPPIFERFIFFIFFSFHRNAFSAF